MHRENPPASDPTGTPASATPTTLPPRNRTAWRTLAVDGNPPTSRPESGADNSHPGLEFDVRQLDRVFFDGLRFDFQYRLGAQLSGVSAHSDLPDDVTKALALALADANAPQAMPLYLWYVQGCFGSAPSHITTYDAWAQDGYHVWARVHDLELGPLVVVVGPPEPSGGDARAAWQGARARALAALGDEPTHHVQMADDGQVAWALLVGQRNRYLDDDGVIGQFGEGQALAPGVLTQSLCSPWQWDFADCGCYYWAASRPDIVTAEAGGAQDQNFQRNRSGQPPESITEWAPWMAHTLSLTQMITQWVNLPLVVGDRENASGTVAPPLPPAAPEPAWSRAQIVQQLRYLATVEHALTVEYLYAAYSLNSPPVPGSGLSADEAQVLARCQGEILRVARDEMHHLNWVNQALHLLGEPASLGRATHYGLPPTGVNATQSPIAFALAPLDDAHLDTLIAIERPSRSDGSDGTPTGSYVHILYSLGVMPDAELGGANPQGLREQLLALIKLLIDEGDMHTERLLATRAALRDMPLQARLRVRGAPLSAPPGTRAALLQEEADACYAAMLRQLASDAAPPPAPAVPSAPSLQSMRRLAEVARELAAQGWGVRFAWPAGA